MRDRSNDSSLHVRTIPLAPLETNNLTTDHEGENKEGYVLFNDTNNTFYLPLYGVGHMVRNHSDSERGNPLQSLHGLLFSISSKESFICNIP